VPEPPAWLANAPRRRAFAIDDVLVDELDPSDGEVLADLGCGSGFTLAAAADKAPGTTLLGIEQETVPLEAAVAVLTGKRARLHLVRADLSASLPLVAACVDKLVCHNVLEQIPEPEALLVEAARVMRPGARSVWSHPDYDSVVISGGDVELTRRIVHLFADLPDPTMNQADAQMGRKLAGLVGQSPLVLTAVSSHVLLSTALDGPARFRVETTVAALRVALRNGEVELREEDLDSWLASLENADGEGRFLYSHITYIVVADKV